MSLVDPRHPPYSARSTPPETLSPPLLAPFHSHRNTVMRCNTTKLQLQAGTANVQSICHLTDLQWSHIATRLKVTVLIDQRLLESICCPFIHSFYLYSASSSPLLLIGTPDTARI